MKADVVKNNHPSQARERPALKGLYNDNGGLPPPPPPMTGSIGTEVNLSPPTQNPLPKLPETGGMGFGGNDGLQPFAVLTPPR